MRSSFERRGTSKRAVVIAVLLALLVGGSAQAFEARRETEVGAYIDGARIFPGGPARMDSQIAHVDPTSMAKMQVV